MHDGIMQWRTRCSFGRMMPEGLTDLSVNREQGQSGTRSKRSNSSVGSKSCSTGFHSSWKSFASAPKNPTFHRTRDFWLCKTDLAAENSLFCPKNAYFLPKSEFSAPEDPDFHRKTLFLLPNREISFDDASFCSKNSAFRGNAELFVSQSRHL